MDFGVLSLIGTAVSAVTGFVGSMQQASATKDAAEYQAAVARNNQIIAQQNAERSAQAGRVQTQNQDLRTRAVIGQIDAAQGASGIDIDSTSSKDVRESAQQLGRFNAQTTLDNAMLPARAQQVQAVNFGAEAGLQQQKADSINPFTAGLGSLFTGVSSFADKWTKFKSPDSSGGLF